MEKSVEVFGTKEVSIKEFMSASDKSLMLLSDFNLAKDNLIALNLKHSIRVSELSEKKVFDSADLKELTGIRAELREPRYLIQKIEKNNVSVFESYKKKDKSNLRELIELNVDLEDSVDHLIKMEEMRKEQEKEAIKLAEQERVAAIEKKIESFETDSYKIIQETNIGNVELHKTMLDGFINDGFDYAEYEIMFEQARARVQSYWDNKCSEVQEKEQQRLENERMKKEIFEVRVKRMSEVGYEFIDDVFVHESLELKFTKHQVYNCSSALFEDELSDIKKDLQLAEQAKRNAEILKQNDEQFLIRKNRLLEIGVIHNIENMFCVPGGVDISSKELIYNASITEFEQILVDAKNAIAYDKEQKQIAEQERLEAIEKAEKQKAIDLELSKKDAVRLKKENAARVKRLAFDKENLSLILSYTELYFKGVTTENQEIKDFIEKAEIKIKNIKLELLNELNNL
jgi:hypothetical protein